MQLQTINTLAGLRKSKVLVRPKSLEGAPPLKCRYSRARDKWVCSGDTWRRPLKKKRRRRKK